MGSSCVVCESLNFVLLAIFTGILEVVKLNLLTACQSLSRQ